MGTQLAEPQIPQQGAASGVFDTWQSVRDLASRALVAEPGTVACRTLDAELWFSEDPRTIETAQQMCWQCPLRVECLVGAIDRAEPIGVWGGELFERGRIVAQPTPKGRPRKDADEVAERAESRLRRRLREAELHMSAEQAERVWASVGRDDSTAGTVGAA